MGAHRRIGTQPHRAKSFTSRRIQGFAHAVQALEFDRDAGGLGHVVDRRQGVGIVGCELRIDMRIASDQRLRASQVGNVRGGLGGKDRGIGTPLHLGALDLGVPIGAFDQPHHQAAACGPGKFDHLVEHFRGTLLIGLHRQSQSPPAA